MAVVPAMRSHPPEEHQRFLHDVQQRAMSVTPRDHVRFAQVEEIEVPRVMFRCPSLRVWTVP